MQFKYLKDKIRGAPELAIRDIVAEVWNHYGYTVKTESDSQHQGVDVIATRSHPYQRKEVIQVEQSSRDPIES